MFNVAGKLVLALSLAMGVTAQVTQTVTPNAVEYAQIKSDLASYHSALTTQSLYIAAEQYLKNHSTTVPPIGIRLQTADWAQGVSSLNALITTTFAPDFPTLVASLYHSALSQQANIINNDISHGGAAHTSSNATATAASSSSAQVTSTVSKQSSSGTATATSLPAASSPGAANSQMIVNGAMVAAGLGIALLM